MIPLKKGQILELECNPYEVLEANDIGVKLAPLTGEAAIALAQQDVDRHFQAGALTLCNSLYGEDVFQDRHAFLLLPAKDREEAWRRERYVREMDDQAQEGGTFSKHLLKRISAEVTDAITKERFYGHGTRAPSVPTLRRWYALWIGSGRLVDALVPNNASKGRPEHRLHPAAEAAMEEVIKNHYLTLDRHSVNHVYEALITLIKSKNDYLPLYDQIPFPGRKTLRARIAEIDPFIRDVKRFGREYAQNRQRLARREHRVATRPNEIWQADATRADVRLVDPVGAKITWRRAFLTTIVDQYTRCVVGYHLSFANPNTESIAAALKVALQPKYVFRTRFPDLQNDWPCWGVPSVLICDNGRENHSEAFRHLCGLLDIELLYAPRKSPQAKPHVERFFRTLNKASHDLPGTTFSNAKEKGPYDPVKRGGLTIHDFEEWLIHFVIDIYHQQYHGAILKSPYHMWLDSSEEEPIRTPNRILEEPAFFMKEETRVLQKDGIHLTHLIYYSPQLQEMFDHRRKTEVTIRYSADVLQSILVADPKRQRWIVADCENMPQYARNHTRREHDAIVKAARKAGKGRIDELAIAEAAFNKRQELASRAARNRKLIAKLMQRPNQSRPEKGARREATRSTPMLPTVVPSPPITDEVGEEWASHSCLPDARDS